MEKFEWEVCVTGGFNHHDLNISFDPYRRDSIYAGVEVN